MTRRSPPRARAERAGILASYVPAGGGPPRRTSDATSAALLRVLGESGDPMRSEPQAAGRRPAARSEAKPSGARPGSRCPAPEEILGRRRAFGLWVNLYSLRGEGDLGIGNLTALRGLVRFAGEVGADFVGLSPLHALRNRGPEICPYAPVSRFFRNPLYLDVEAVPEWRDCGEARVLLERARGEAERLRAAPRIDHDAASRLHGRILRALQRAFAARHAGRDTARGRAHAAFLKRGGGLLRDFATFLALEDAQARLGRPRDWHAWPAPLRDPAGPEVARFRARHAEAVAFHAWVQFELDRQLAAVAAEARRAGLAIGLYQDLALGGAGTGFDTWRLGSVFLEGAHLGAPPDLYARQGQDWTIPPPHPARLAAGGGGAWRSLLAANLDHAGALRIDHVLGLFRQWWIPRGWPAARGAYVRFPAEELLAVLADETRRRGALAIGEDLGTVPPQVGPALARFGVLSSRVLLFEREHGRRFKPSARWSRRALATANTHDLPTLAAFWSGSDLELRAHLGLLGGRGALARARAQRAEERRLLLARLVAEGCLPRRAGEPAHPELCAAVHAFLCRTPAPLVGVSLDDLAGEEEPVNVPGLGQDAYPSWTRRMALSVERLADDPGVRRALAGTRRRAAWKAPIP
jgi:4-alpha-glucanotransferase